MTVLGETSEEYAPAIQDCLRILLVDDDPILREFGIVHLSTETAEVTTAANGAEALDILERSVVDIILLDLEMPEVDGFEVLRRVRDDEALRSLPVIVVTGHEDVLAIDNAYRAGATSFIVKPINWRQLSYQIQYVHRAARADRTLFAEGREAQAASERATASLMELARQSAKFMQLALQAAPELRPAAGDFATALQRAAAGG